MTRAPISTSLGMATSAAPTITSASPDSATNVPGSSVGATASATTTTLPAEEPASIENQTPPATMPPATMPPATPPTATPPSATASPTVPAGGPTPDGPLIDYFRASSETADPGDRITLEWMTTGAITVTLWRLAPTGQFSAFWDVDAVGTFEYDIGQHERNQTRFALFAGDDTGKLDSATLSVTLRCPDSWFFSNPPDICPANAAIFSDGAEQRFENGLMLWVGGEDRIYVLYDDGRSPKWGAFGDEWDPGEPDSDPDLNPPPGYFQPIRGFGLVWREQASLRDRLGWATAEETPYPTAVQRPSHAKYNETYIRATDGAIWKLLPERSGWEKIPG